MRDADASSIPVPEQFSQVRFLSTPLFHLHGILLTKRRLAADVSWDFRWQLTST